MKKFWLPVMAGILTIGCTTMQQTRTNTHTETTTTEATAATSQDKKGIGIELENMDRSVRPQDDFYHFVNGTWMANTTVPSDRGRWGSFDKLREFTDSVSLDILHKSIKKKHAAGSEGEKVAFLYASIMDTARRNALGITPIAGEFAAIDAVKNIADLQKLMVEATPYNGNEIFDVRVSAHMKNSNQNAVFLSGPGLGMNRDYYHKKDESTKEKLQAYRNYLERLFKFANVPDAANAATRVVELENELANHINTIEQSRDASRRFNPVAVKDLKQITPALDLSKNLQKMGITTDTVIIAEINYYKNLSNILTPKRLPAFKEYLKARTLNRNAQYLSQELEQLHFDFYSKELQGITEMRDREKRALSTINGMIGQAFGKLYVEDVFPPEAKETAVEMVDYIKQSFRHSIENLAWMSDETKVKALEKLNSFNVKIGYPDHWKDYSALTILHPDNDGSYFNNIKTYNFWRNREMLDKVGKPVDKTEWFMSPQTVNAYYSPQYNEIVFPAAILQPPFYNYKADAAVNFGGMGAVIGHEISHGFDDSGSQFDGQGNLNNWWTEQDLAAFKSLGDKLAAQYSSYEVLPGAFVNGRSTLGENIADLGGVRIAHHALQNYLKDHGNPGLIDGFTQDQRFFISWATIWRTKSTQDALRNQIRTDYHSPGFFRAIGPLENLESFYKAFNVTENDEMYKPKSERIIIW
ncbi:MAG: M13 family metallopeptidase [Weeksellaceae bacterium]|nr:M13 family metallopeptidase [Weeksellaceae bacterium]